MIDEKYVKALEERNVELWKKIDELQMKLAMTEVERVAYRIMLNKDRQSSTFDKVLDFAAMMRYKLSVNEDKGGWDNCSPSWLRGRVDEELKEFDWAMLHGELKDVVEEAADVANFLMMLIDKKAQETDGDE